MIAAAHQGYITPANIEVKTLLSGNSKAEHGKCGGTTAKRYPSLHATKNFSIETLRWLHEVPVILKAIAPV